MNLLITNIKELVQVEINPVSRRNGTEMNQLNTVQNAYLEIRDGAIASFGKMKDAPNATSWSGSDVIDATGKMVFPSWCDSHSHLVFAASREGEFVDRIKGLTYEDIALRGGGILNSARKLEQMDEESLYESAQSRLKEVMALGTGAIEIKSGYGLSVSAELKMLRVIKKLKDNSPVTIKATFLGAHAIPEEFKNNRKEYIDLIINEMLPAIQKENLADYIDVFCEKNYYTPDETNLILSEGKKIGLIPKIHVNQFNAIGGVQVGVEHNALSVDHLEVMRPEDIAILKGTDTMPTALPSCSFFLGIPYAPAKEIIEAGLPLALASDYNPGSTPSGNMNFVVSLGCIKMGLSPEQAINAATINTAYAMELSEEMGSIAIGKKGNVFITKNIPSYSFLPYSFGQNVIETTILNGKVVT
ncbi:MAG: imidazolonepropionase [Crocinitomicaceae bacterium]|jgi:imidazolonepropionase|nr:imidazolonepropionase [Crocinitomicaceae bacterium]MBT5403841.1 imidazolonepropionase [Crocinitomicaceae bacterium]MBT6028961.1 imidazolonepropionase [Crocinitomicaceae bacterium]